MQNQTQDIEAQDQIEIRPSGQHFSVDVILAAHYGLEEAFLIHHFQHWIRINKNNGTNFKDGSYWTYQTLEQISDNFPFLNPRQVKYAIENLVKQKVLKIGNYNKIKIDKTHWYAFVREDIYLPDLPKKSKNVYERQNCLSTDKIVYPSDKIVSPIPDTKTESIQRSLEDNVFDEENGEIIEPTKSKYPLKKEQSEVFSEMKELGLECDDDLLMIIIRDCWKKNKVEHLKNCIHHLKFNIESGYKFNERIAFFRHALAGNQQLITAQCLRNKFQAEHYCKSTGWNNVTINEKYASISNQNGDVLKEISMYHPEEEFKKQFVNLHKLSKEYAQ